MSFRSLSFRFYFPVLVVALAGAVFGLGAIFGLGVVKPSSSPPAKAVAAETKFTTEPKVVQKKSPVEQATSSSALSPIYPTKPGAPRADESAAPPAAQADKAAAPPAGADEAAAKSAARTDERAKPSGVAAPPAAEASAAAKVTEAAPPPDKPSARQGIQAETTAAADSDKTTGSVPHEDVARAPAAKPAVKPVAKPAVKPAEATVARGSKTCDVRACASAYKSFRESDCTYQPFAGPRQVCEGPPGGRSTFASEPHERRSSVARERARRDVEEDASDDRASAEFDADEDDDGPRGEQRMIVIEPRREWRDWR